MMTTQKKVNRVLAKDGKSAKAKTDPMIAAIDALKTEVNTLKSYRTDRLKASWKDAQWQCESKACHK